MNVRRRVLAVAGLIWCVMAVVAVAFCPARAASADVTEATWQDVQVLSHVTTALTTDGRLYTWGYQTADTPLLGNGTTESTNTPTQILDRVSWYEMTADVGYAVRDDGSLWTWGSGYFYSTGTGSKNAVTAPTKVLESVTELYAGSSSAALTESGALYTWGSDSSGQLGDGAQVQSRTPTKVLDDVESFAWGDNHAFAAAIKTDGTLWMWGDVDGDYGETIWEPRQIQSLDGQRVVDFCSKGKSFGAITEEGSLYMWGDGSEGLLGNHEGGYVRPFKLLDGVDRLIMDSSTNVGAIKTNGELWTWDNLIAGGTIPKKFMDNVRDVSFKWSSIVTTADELYTWGWPDDGVLGFESESGHSVSEPTWVMDGVSEVVTRGAAHDHNRAVIKHDGSLWMWGNDNGAGQLGLGTEDTPQVTPAKVMDSVAQVDLADTHCAAIATDGSLWLWGANSFGELGPQADRWGSTVPLRLDGVSSANPPDADDGEGFVVDEDGNSYWHYYATDERSGFYGVEGYPLSDKDMSRIMNRIEVEVGDDRDKLDALKSYVVARSDSSYERGGACYGIAATIGQVYNGDLALEDLSDSGESNYWRLPRPAEDEQHLSTIDYNYLMQCVCPPDVYGFAELRNPGRYLDPAIWEWWGKTSDDVVVKMFEDIMGYLDQDKAVMITTNNHAVLLVGYRQNQDGSYTFDLFDENSVEPSTSYLGALYELHVSADLTEFSCDEDYLTFDQDSEIQLCALLPEQVDPHTPVIEATSGVSSIVVNTAETFTVTNEEGQSISVDGRALDGDMDFVDLHTVVDVRQGEEADGMRFNVEVDSEPVYDISGVSGKVSAEFYGNGGMVMVDASDGVTGGVVAVGKGVSLEGSDYDFKFYVSTDGRVDKDSRGVVMVQGHAMSDVALEAVDDKVRIVSEGGVSDVKVKSIGEESAEEYAPDNLSGGSVAELTWGEGVAVVPAVDPDGPQDPSDPEDSKDPEDPKDPADSEDPNGSGGVGDSSEPDPSTSPENGDSDSGDGLPDTSDKGGIACVAAVVILALAALCAGVSRKALRRR